MTFLSYVLVFMAGVTFGAIVMAMMAVASDDDRERGYDALPEAHEYDRRAERRRARAQGWLM